MQDWIRVILSSTHVVWLFSSVVLCTYSDVAAIWVWSKGEKQTQIYGSDNVCPRRRSWSWNTGRW